MKDPKEVVIVTPKSSYLVPVYQVTNDGLADAGEITVHLCKGDRNDQSVPRQAGMFTESLLQIAVTYLQENNVGDLLNRDTSIAITHIEDALLRLGKRAEDRKKRGVQASYQK